MNGTGKKTEKKRRGRGADALDFEHGYSFPLTDVPCRKMAEMMPYLRESFPRMDEKKMHAYMNAIAYLSEVYTPWRKVPGFKNIHRFYSRLKGCGMLDIMKVMLRRETPLYIRRPKAVQEESAAHKPSRRTCPQCGREAVICCSTRRRNGVTIRYYRCTFCGRTATRVHDDMDDWRRKDASTQKMSDAGLFFHTEALLMNV